MADRKLCDKGIFQSILSIVLNHRLIFELFMNGHLTNDSFFKFLDFFKAY